MGLAGCRAESYAASAPKEAKKAKKRCGTQSKAARHDAAINPSFDASSTAAPQREDTCVAAPFGCWAHTSPAASHRSQQKRSTIVTAESQHPEVPRAKHSDVGWLGMSLTSRGAAAKFPRRILGAAFGDAEVQTTTRRRRRRAIW